MRMGVSNLSPDMIASVNFCKLKAMGLCKREITFIIHLTTLGAHFGNLAILEIV